MERLALRSTSVAQLEAELKRREQPREETQLAVERDERRGRTGAPGPPRLDLRLLIRHLAGS